MTEPNLKGDGASASNAAAPASTSDKPRLEGHMGVTEVVFTVLAFSGPLTVVFGYLPLVIIFDGIGAPTAFLVATVLLMVFSVGYTRMALHLPNPGASYAYVTAGLGRVFGLGAACMSIFGYVVLELGVFCFIGNASQAFVTGTLGGPDFAWYWHTLFFWAIVSVTGYLNVEFTAKTVVVISAIGLVIIAAFEALAVYSGGPEGLSPGSFSWSAFVSGSPGLGLLFAILVFIGFESTAIYREEVKDARRTIPKATYLSVLIIGLVYMSATWCLVVSSGPSRAHAVAAANPSGMLSVALEAYAGRMAVVVATGIMIVSSLAVLLSIHNVAARYCYSVGYDGALPRFLGRAHPRHHSPYIASMADSLVTLVAIVIFAALSLDPNYLYARLGGTATVAILAIYMLTSVAIVFFFRRNSADTNLWERAIAPLLSTVGLAVVLWLAMANFDTIIDSNWTTASLLLLLIWAVPAGGMVLATYYRSKRPETYQRIGRN